MNFIGVDLAWGCSPTERSGNESGVLALDATGIISDAGWTIGIPETVEWIVNHAQDDTLVFVDAPLVVTNERGQRLCEQQVGQRYGRWKVAANSTNLDTPRLAGMSLVRELQSRGWSYADGIDGPPAAGRFVSECYPYTAIVGAEELGYAIERPRYKRSPKKMRITEFRGLRAAACDELIQRIAGLATADPPLHLQSHPITARLVAERSPLSDREYKHREDLLDAALCAWTAALWWRWGTERCQVLGIADSGTTRPAATIIAPARPQQRSERPARGECLPALQPFVIAKMPEGVPLPAPMSGPEKSSRRPSKGKTTVPGFVNRNGQHVLRATGLPGNDHVQLIYVLRCDTCRHEYGANGSDIFQRKCPACQGGAPGLRY